MKITRSQLTQIIKEELSGVLERSTERIGAKLDYQSFGRQPKTIPAGTTHPATIVRQKVVELIGPYIKELFDSGNTEGLSIIEDTLSDLIIGRGQLREEDT